MRLLHAAIHPSRNCCCLTKTILCPTAALNALSSSSSYSSTAPKWSSPVVKFLENWLLCCVLAWAVLWMVGIPSTHPRDDDHDHLALDFNYFYLFIFDDEIISSCLLVQSNMLQIGISRGDGFWDSNWISNLQISSNNVLRLNPIRSLCHKKIIRI